MFSIQSNKCIAHKTLGSINQLHDFVNTLIIPCPNISLSLTGLSSVSFEVFSAIVFKKKLNSSTQNMTILWDCLAIVLG